MNNSVIQKEFISLFGRVKVEIRLQQNEAVIKVIFNGKKDRQCKYNSRFGNLLFITARGTSLVP